MIVLIITNIILAVVIGIAGIALLVETVRESRPIIIKEAKALREYYEDKLKDMQKRKDEADNKRAEYKELYQRELQRNEDIDRIREERDELEMRVKCLTNERDACVDRVDDMAQENANLKEQIKALKKPAKKTKGKAEE